MNKRKMSINTLFVFVILAMILSSGFSLAGSTFNANRELKMRGRISQEERRASAKTYNDLVEAAKAAGTLALPTLVQGPDGYLVPDYFGTANWAYSPLLTKFVDELPGLGAANQNLLGQYIPVAVPDKTTYPGSDYYEIAVVEYKEQLHSELPETTLRGYVQLSTSVVPGAQAALTYLSGGNIFKGDGTQALAVDVPHYLGPAIVSESNRPVRIKFYNLLPTGVEGDLFIPTDTSVMGSGSGPVMGENYTQNRSNIHMHGNNTVWISDGTPHQWITPAGETTSYPQGVSVMDVPDMNPSSVSSETDGTTTLFYSNAQSARLMFYHDHSYGITRLNVYAGEAAPYIIQDQVEKDLIDGTNLSGVNPLNQKLLPDVGMPLVIQDKTFVSDTTMETDPTWAWGTNAYTPGTPYVAVVGDLWYPHVYSPAQNPFAMDGVNPFGRWMYGPWFWPPTSTIEFGPVANPYYDPLITDPNDPNYRPPLMPGSPHPSAPGESFMDTPLVNGTAYPYMDVDPKAYRFRILNAANDRFFNLQMYIADDSYAPGTPGYLTEVKMVPVTPEVSIPSHLEQIMPDPLTKGPDIIQIGTEGGWLPAPVVIPAQPISWNLVGTAFNFGNVAEHSLLLGSAERADVIIDFSAYRGKTLILYNDAPAPFPANDSRYDYYTNNPDQVAEGGAPSTLPGKGPNTRTIMQIRVADIAPAAAYDVDALKTVFAKTATKNGVFETTQEPIIIPQAAYNSAYGVTNLPADPYRAYVQLFETSKTFQPINSEGVLQPQVTLPFQPKAMHDEMGGVYDEYGRMSGFLGLDNPIINSTAANFLAYGYASPPVDIIKGVADLDAVQMGSLTDGTQIWKITHNGVDTHPIHTHMFNAQLINRVAMDGALLPPDANELGFKETFRINPLEIIIIAMRPKLPVAPFQVPNSVRPIDVTMPIGEPLKKPPPAGWFNPQGISINEIFNHEVNFGAEYVWHCHILSHEEMDMMHDLSLVVPPANPSGLSISLSGSGTSRQATLSWTDNSVNETSYTVQRATASTGPWSTLSVRPANTTSYINIVGNNSYYYRVFASNTVGDTLTAGFPTVTSDSDFSNVVSVTAQAPAAVTGLTATAMSTTSIRVNWTAVPGAVGYNVVRSTSLNGTYTSLGVTSNTNYTNNGLSPNTTYYYKVRAYVLNGTTRVYGDYSTAASATTPFVPATVTGLTAAPISATSIRLNWTAVPGVAGYNIARSTSLNGTYTSLGVLAGTTYTNSDLSPNTTYYYKVRAYVLNGTTRIYGPYSTVASASTPAIPPMVTGLTAVRVSATSIRLNWTAVPGVVGYNVRRSTSLNGTYISLGVTPNITYTNTGLTTGTQYFYQVYAYTLLPDGTRIFGPASAKVSTIP